MNTIEKALSKQKKLADIHPYHDEKNLKSHKTQVTKDNVKPTKNIFDELASKQTESEIDLSTVQANINEESKAEKKVSKKITLDLDNMNSFGYLVPNHNNENLNEEYRQIKRPLLNNIKGKSAHPIKNANVIQVTSSVQSEGKSFTAVNLALSFAIEMDFNVLLVDADTIKSSLSNTLFDKKELGLNDYLSGDIKELSELMFSTNIPKLSILPAGSRHKYSTELLNSENMDKLISEFSERYDNRIVIFDSPPLLQTNDARILSQKVGQVVFVVEQNKTEQNVVQNAIAILDPNIVIGVVMNKSLSSSHSGYYGYYGYGYGSSK